MKKSIKLFILIVLTLFLGVNYVKAISNTLDPVRQVGTYYLVETSSPEGFELNSNKIEFTVNGTDEIIEVIMENQLEVKVPDTLSSRSTLLLAIAMFDIALGIGIVTYVKKNKVEE